MDKKSLITRASSRENTFLKLNILSSISGFFFNEI